MKQSLKYLVVCALIFASICLPVFAQESTEEQPVADGSASVSQVDDESEAHVTYQVRKTTERPNVYSYQLEIHIVPDCLLQKDTIEAFVNGQSIALKKVTIDSFVSADDLYYLKVSQSNQSSQSRESIIFESYQPLKMDDVLLLSFDVAVDPSSAEADTDKIPLSVEGESSYVELTSAGTVTDQLFFNPLSLEKNSKAEEVNESKELKQAPREKVEDKKARSDHPKEKKVVKESVTSEEEVQPDGETLPEDLLIPSTATEEEEVPSAFIEPEENQEEVHLESSSVEESVKQAQLNRSGQRIAGSIQQQSYQIAAAGAILFLSLVFVLAVLLKQKNRNRKHHTF